jgi:hypothetical protein
MAKPDILISFHGIISRLRIFTLTNLLKMQIFTASSDLPRIFLFPQSGRRLDQGQLQRSQ